MITMVNRLTLVLSQANRFLAFSRVILNHETDLFVIVGFGGPQGLGVCSEFDDGGELARRKHSCLNPSIPAATSSREISISSIFLGRASTGKPTGRLVRGLGLRQELSSRYPATVGNQMDLTPQTQKP